MAGAAVGTDHRVHGMGDALEVAAWPAITPEEAATVLSRFPAAGRSATLTWHSPRPFSAATLVRTGLGEFLLKRHHQDVRTPDALALEHAFITHLAQAGSPVPELVSTTSGESVIGDGVWTYELHRKSPGLDLYRDRPSWTPFLTRSHAWAAGAALARLHRASRGFQAPGRDRQPLVPGFTILPAPNPLAAAETYVAARPALATFLAGRAWREELSALFASRAAGLGERLADQPPLWTHNDWHPSNLLWSPSGDVRTVIDFGLATRTCALHDLATAIERAAIAWLRLGQDDHLADTEAALAIVAGYRSILPLTGDDVAAVVQLLPLVHVEFALSEIDYFVGTVGRPDQAAAAWDDYLVGHTRWFLSPSGRALTTRIGEA